MALFRDITEQDITENYVYVWTPSIVLTPSTRKYWAGTEWSFMTFNPQMILAQLQNARKKVQDALASKKNILVVAEKEMVAAEITALAKEKNFHYMLHKTPWGFLTNFDTLIKRIAVMNEKKQFIASENFSKTTKKEQEQMKRSLRKIQKVYEGVGSLQKKPDLVVVLDGSQMMSLVKELALTGIDNVVMASSDFSQRREKNNLVTMNVNSYKSIMFVFNYLFS